MDPKEYALLAFSILASMSAGSFLVLVVARGLATRKTDAIEAGRLSSYALLGIIPVLALAMLASLFHLGNPINAWKAILNVGSSWLAREILCTALFLVAAGAFAVMQWRRLGSLALRNGTAVLAAVLGLALVFSMSQAYSLRTVPAWNIGVSPLSFFATALLLGALAVGAGLVANYAFVVRQDRACAETQCNLLRYTLRWIALVAIVLVGVEFLILPLQMAFLGVSGGPAAFSLGMMLGEFGVVLGLRLALVFVGAGILGAFMYQTAQVPGREKMLGYLAYVAFLFVLVGEVLGRFLFYATYARVGL